MGHADSSPEAWPRKSGLAADCIAGRTAGSAGRTDGIAGAAGIAGPAGIAGRTVGSTAGRTGTRKGDTR